MQSHLKYQLALTLLEGFGIASLRPLLEQYNATEIFTIPPAELLENTKVNPACLDAITEFKNWRRVEKEIDIIEKNKIQTYFITDTNYPYRLRECADAPLLLYGRGSLNLNAPKVLAIVGTRRNSPIGKKFTEEILSGIQEYSDTIIVSGLAAGIDTLAHQGALKNKLPTLAVLAHGLDRIYPAENRSLAMEIINSGGCLITECRYGEAPDRYLFPRRNRIVAGISDATLVIESDLKGGSLITANLAFDYARTVLAMPGRVFDEKSSGCLELIKSHKAQLVTNAADLLYCMNWEKQIPTSSSKKKKNNTRFTAEESVVMNLLMDGEEKHIDFLLQTTAWPPTQLAAVLLNLTLEDHIVSLPGNKYLLI